MADLHTSSCDIYNSRHSGKLQVRINHKVSVTQLHKLNENQLHEVLHKECEKCECIPSLVLVLYSSVFIWDLETKHSFFKVAKINAVKSETTVG